MFSRRNWRYFGWLIFGMLGFYLIFVNRSQFESIDERLEPQFSWQPSLAKYQLISTSNEFSVERIVDNIYISKSQFGRNLRVVDKNIFFVGSLDAEAPSLLYKFNLLDNKVEWQISTIITEPIVLSSSMNKIFVSFGLPSVTIAYDKNSGAEIWKSQFPAQIKSAEYTFVDPDSLSINFALGQFERIDISTGKKIETMLPIDVFPIYLIQDEVIYHTKRRQLNATEKLSGQLLWATPILDEEIRIAPVFTEDFIVIQTGIISLNAFYVIDRKDGTVVWESDENVASNVSVDGGNLFYLTEDSRLIAQNMKSGEIIGEVSFSPALHDMERIDFVNSEFSVVASDGYVLVYFGSGRQLFAFRFSPL